MRLWRSAGDDPKQSEPIKPKQGDMDTRGAIAGLSATLLIVGCRDTGSVSQAEREQALGGRDRQAEWIPLPAPFRHGETSVWADRYRSATVTLGREPITLEAGAIEFEGHVRIEMSGYLIDAFDDPASRAVIDADSRTIHRLEGAFKRQRVLWPARKPEAFPENEI